MVAKITDEMYCRVLEWTDNDKVKGWNFCVIMGEKPMINSFAGLVEEMKLKADEIAPIDALPTPENGAAFEVEIFGEGDP